MANSDTDFFDKPDFLEDTKPAVKPDLNTYGGGMSSNRPTRKVYKPKPQRNLASWKMQQIWSLVVIVGGMVTAGVSGQIMDDSKSRHCQMAGAVLFLIGLIWAVVARIGQSLSEK